jgi:hypothetical protein
MERTIMATRKVKLTGVAEWVKVFEETRDMKGFEGAFEAHDGAYTVNIILPDAEFKKLKDAGSIKKGTKTEDGDTNVKITRKHADRFEWASGAPVVTNSGKPWSYADGLIPNGSIVELDVVVYDTKRPSIKGTRLEGLNILNLATMDGESEDSDTDADDGIPF